MAEEQTNRRILLVDDNPSIHADFAKILSPEDSTGLLSQIEVELFGSEQPSVPTARYEIESAHQGQQALEMVRRQVELGQPYAAAFVDMRMPPGWNGIDTICHLWEVDPELQVVICTAYSDYSWSDIVARLGRSDRYLILKKPFDSAEVRQLALTLTTKWNLARQARLREDQLETLVDVRTRELAQRKEQLELEMAERLRAEQVLRLTQFSVDHAADAVFWITQSGSFHYVNEQACNCLGYTREQLLQGKTIFDISAEADPDLWVGQWNRLEREGRWTLETHFRRSDGAEFPVEVTTSYLQFDGHQYQCAFVRDITDRKRAEQALQDLVAGTAALTGEEFFPALVWHLTRALEVKVAIVAERAKDRPDHVRVVSIWGTDRMRPGTDIDIKGLPFERVLNEGYFSCTDQLQRTFPSFDLAAALNARTFVGVSLMGLIGQPVGLLCVLDSKFMADPRRAQSIMNVFGARAASELERERVEQALFQSQERYALAAQGANDGLWDWNIKTNELYLSPRWKAMLGYEDSEILNHPDSWFNLVHADDVQRLRRDLDAHLQGQTEHFESEHRMLAKDGAYRWMLSRGLAVRAFRQAYRMAGSQTDVTARKLIEDKLRHDANHDRLTSLPNRAMFMSRLAHCIERARRNHTYQYAVLFLDLDRFKVINDSLGHVVGDKLLVEMAARLTSCLREIDTVARCENTVARLGGDEFTILLEDISDVTDAIRVAERIRHALSLPIQLVDQHVTTGVSIGIATSKTGYARPEDILRDADTAMYHAKADRSGGYQIFDKNMHARAVRRLEMESDLRRALENRELRPCYQPIVSMTTGQVVGFEALLRWPHPVRGIVFPSNFIPVAEETGLINPIGRDVLRTSCMQIKELQELMPDQRRLAISVNISGKQLAEPSFPDEVHQIIHETGIDPRSLMLEVTESVMMSVATDAQVLERLKQEHVQLLIDDFGTGYSSLCYLPSFPMDGIKIGPPFVTNLGTLIDYSAVLKAITRMAHDLSLSVIAEGIEDVDQLAALRAFGCDYCQGHFFSKPLDFEQARELVMEQKRFEVV